MSQTAIAPMLDRGRLPALGWAAFVGCSWTWCIGMYLPVLMIRQFGEGAWWVFAAPNVLGAAALGWILHRPGAAASLARRHWHAAAMFSVVTVLFHAFFVGWVIRSLVGDAAEIVTATASVGIYFLGRRGRRDLLIAAILLIVSLAAFAVAASLPAHSARGTVGAESVGLLWLAPVCVFGFFLCPYLDLTFLRARASTESHTGIAAFTLGFGVMFLAMIVFTLWYARIVPPDRLHAVPRSLAWLIGGHMMLQSAFTVALHTRALSEDRRAQKPELVISFFVALVIAFLLGASSERVLPRGYNSGEFIYRLFMAFYGLIFPAYVWLCMIPPGQGKTAPRGRMLAVLVLTVLIAAPMFWLGFIENRMIWLGPGLLVVVLARGVTLI